MSTDGPLKASLEHGVATLAPLHITGPGTDLTAQGKAALFGTSRSLDAKAVGTIDLKVAHTFDPDIQSSGGGEPELYGREYDREAGPGRIGRLPRC